MGILASYIRLIKGPLENNVPIDREREGGEFDKVFRQAKISKN